MEIDIIDYMPEQYDALTYKQLKEIWSAQNKKDAALSKLKQSLDRLRERVIDNGVYPSTIYEDMKGKLTTGYEAEVDDIKEKLLFYLQYAQMEEDPKDTGASGVLYTVDYRLSYQERMEVVKQYYKTYYSSLQGRFNAFKTDKFAKSYLGEWYSTLWHYFQDAVTAG